MMSSLPEQPNLSPETFAVGVPASSSGGDAMLGYPAVEPPSIDLGPLPSGVGAKPSVKAGTSESSGQSGAKGRPEIKRAGPPKRTGPPLPKRPKGRLFIGSVFFAVFVGFAATVFNVLLRYSAYGEVVARRIELAAPWPGVVASIHVREGDLVQSGELIARIDSLEMRQKIEEIDDALRLERARLSSELAMLRWEAEKIRDVRKLAQSDFYDKWSELLWEQSRLADLRMQLERIEPMQREGAASEERTESLRFQVAGQEKRVEQLTEAVRALQHRTDDSPAKLSLEDRVQPTLVRIENLQAELQRTRQMIYQGEIRAPANGRILRTNRFVGEYTDQSTPVAELFVEGSTELVLYLPQSEAQYFPVGRVVTLHINPINANIQCEVRRIDMEMRHAPKSLARHYRADQRLLPVYLRAKDALAMPNWLALGSEVRLPRTANLTPLDRLREWWNDEPRESARTSNPLRSEESALPARTVSGQVCESPNADKKMDTGDGRTAGFSRRTNIGDTGTSL